MRLAADTEPCYLLENTTWFLLKHEESVSAIREFVLLAVMYSAHRQCPGVQDSCQQGNPHKDFFSRSSSLLHLHYITEGFLSSYWS